MPLTAFDHVNVRTAKLNAMIAWYGDVLGMHPGKRPDFDFPGAWLYLGDTAHVHLVGIAAPAQSEGNLALEHFAFRAAGMADFLANLTARGIEHRVNAVPGFPVAQVDLRDPDGNHIHVDFDASEVPH